MSLASFQCLVLTPPGHDDPSLAIAASRAGGIGVFNAEFHRDNATVIAALDRIARFTSNPFGIRFSLEPSAPLLEMLLERSAVGLLWAILDPETAQAHGGWMEKFCHAGGHVVVETTSWDPELTACLPAVDGWIVKGHEAGGVVGEETTFILLQKALASCPKPVYARGGIGMHSAAACFAAGASGVILDSQMLLLQESMLKDFLRPLAEKLVGTETVALGDPETGCYMRILERPGFKAARQLREKARQLSFARLREECVRLCGWEDPQSQVLPLGQDVAFAANWAKRYVSVAGVLQALRASLPGHLEQANGDRALSAGSSLARSHGTQYPIVQGPMTRVSDTAAFAQAVAEQGGLPMLALALMKADAVRDLFAETAKRLEGRPWGVGLLGFAPSELLAEQMAVIREFQPAFALIAGGRPDQALVLQNSGIPSYLHVPSPRLLSLFLEQGARRFVFEGRECGGHIGPLCSFVLWETMVETLLAEMRDGKQAEEIHLLFAGGIADARGAAMVATMAAPLTAMGVRVGVLMGSAYLFTREIVGSGAVVPAFHEQALLCRRTVALETGTGHASRCVNTPFAEEFFRLRRQLQAEGKDADQIRQALEELNLGRLRLAAKAKERSGNEVRDVPVARQVQDGMYMIGQVATLLSKVSAIADLHHSVTDEACKRIEERCKTLSRAQPRRTEVRPADIAIVGVGCMLPKAHNAREYWENILNRVDGIIEIPKARWDWRLYFDPDRNAEDKIYSRWGGFLDDMVFDPLRYGIPPKAIKAIDPLQLMSLEVVRQTLEDAGYAERGFDRTKVSVILGASGGTGDVGAQYAVRSETPRFTGELAAELAARLPKWTEDSFAGILPNVAAGRAANRFDFGGVNFTVDAACASSLTAVYLAVVELEDHRSDMVIAGGVDTVQGPFGYLCFSRTQALSPRGCCSTFDASADGIVISEGIAMVALKRLVDAERDGDQIYAVIKGIGGSSDGRAKSMTAPHPEGQIQALSRAYEKAGYSPASVGLFEAHGTGTVAGDTAELETVTRLLAASKARPKQSAIGSVKTLIGHTKATAGTAGLIKAALALYYRVLPPHANVKKPNSKIADPHSPLYLVKEPQPWVSLLGEPRRAGVSSFGFGGTNFHVTLEEYREDFLPSRRPAVLNEWPAELFVWWGRDRGALSREVTALSTALAPGLSPCLRDLSHTLAERALRARGERTSSLPLAKEGQRVGVRGEEGECAAVVAHSLEELQQKQESLAAHLEDSGKALPPGAYYNPRPLAREGKVAVMFAGQGAQYPHMLRALALIFPDITAVLEEAEEVLFRCSGQGGASVSLLSRLIYPGGLYSPEEEAEAHARLMPTEVAQLALGAIEAGLWRLMQRLRLPVDMAAGHSYGEYVALYAAGVLGLNDLLRVSEARGRFIAEASAGKDLGTMAAVTMERGGLERLVEGFPGLVVANHNAPLQSVVSGPRASVQRLVAALQAEGVDASMLPVGAAFHSPLVAPAQERLAEFLATLQLHPMAFPVYSNTTGQPHASDVVELRGTLSEHLVRSVEFVAEVEAMYEAGARLFVGLGPRNTQGSLVHKILGERPHRIIPIDDHEGGLKGLLHGLAALWCEGVAIDVAPLYAGRDCRVLDLQSPASWGRQPSVPKHAWMLNGSGARRADELVSEPLTLEVVQRRKTEHIPPPASTIVKLTLPSQGQGQEKIAMSEEQPPPWEGGALPSHAQRREQNQVRESVLLTYQEVMRQFLQVQENVMLAYLGGAAARAGAVAQPVSGTRALAAGRLIQFPKPTLGHDRDPLATTVPTGGRHRDLPEEGVLAPPSASPQQPTAKPVVPAAPEVKEFAAPPSPLVAVTASISLDGARGVGIEAQGERPGVDASLRSEEGITQTLLGIVEQCTGYPRDMLGLDQNMEADLGIDSIKRVEIVGALLKALPEELIQDRSKASQTLNNQKTLRDIIASLAAQQPPKEAAVGPFEETGKGEKTVGGAPLSRFSLVAQPEPADLIPLDSIEPGIYFIVGHGSSSGDELASLLERQGGIPVFLEQEVLVDDDRLRAQIARARNGEGRMCGLIYLLPLDTLPLRTMAPLSMWREQTARNDKGLHRLLQLLAEDLREGGRVIAASSLGGYFARGRGKAVGLTAQGGAVGLLKSLKEEWPKARMKCVDLDPAVSAADNAQHVFQELRLPGGRIEVGYPAGQRVIFTTQPAPLGTGAPEAARELRPEWVVLATGGACGITAEMLMELAAVGMQLIVVGRTPEPGCEDPELAACPSTVQLRALLLNRARAAGLCPKPVEIEAELNRILREQEIAANLRDLRQAGGKVEYLVADVRNEDQVAALIRDIYERYGRLDGVVHGAGVIEDKLLVDKTPESVERVFDTKVDGAYLLARFVDPQQLKFMVFFSSVAGRYGNSGQTDYAAANEVVNRLAWQLSQCWEKKVKVCAINWGPWAATRQGRGMVSPETKRKFEARGIELVSLAGGRRFFMDEILRGPLEQVEVVAGEGPWEAHEAERDAFPSLGVQEEQVVGRTYRGSVPGQVVYPLLSGAVRRVGARGEVLLRRRFSTREDPYLGEHLLDGIPVMPAACALELMAEAAAAVWPDWIVTEVSDLRVLRGIRLLEAELDLEVIALASSHGDANGFAASLMICQAGGGQPTFYRATVHLGGEVPEATPYHFDLHLQPPSFSVQQAYREWLFHGPCLQTIRGFGGLDERGAIAEVHPTDPSTWRPGIRWARGEGSPSSPSLLVRGREGVRIEESPWLFDPGLIDSAPQLAIVWARQMRSALALPNRFGRVRRFGAGPLGRCTLHFLVDRDQSADQVKADVFFVDEKEQVRLSIEAMECSFSAALKRLGGTWKGVVQV